MSKQGYHHGNLRQALIQAALELIPEQGPTGFTLSEAAKRAGVTPAAVYRHFEGREDLIAECARQGYAIFADVMAHAWADGKPSALAAFSATGRAYLAFARQFPGHYMAMFESGILPNRSPNIAEAAARAQDITYRAASALMAHIPSDRRPPVAMFAAHIRALSHGVVELYARTPTSSPFSPEELLESGIGVYLRGLGLIAQDQ
ncbi:TetR/AcrR family transcriptional regulator [Albirhodobacter sp. R86504]|jgi:AcrR family transcriptional regulator|uniref:TetR/AcrR family transcriptional regulator n=1 Tax=Albirhodobacter sp. R86504 TaxID=3093848 RepID=UPI003673584C